MTTMLKLSRDVGGVAVDIAAERITAIVSDATGTGCAVHVVASDEPFRVRERASDVVAMLTPGGEADRG